VATPQGMPQANTGWSQEIALDIEWAHAIAPGAHILLVEAQSSSLNDLLGAVDYARRIPTVAAVSMSWGSSEFRTESSYDGYFSTPAGHTGVAFFGASGDNGAPGIWPAASANVIAVGGSTLQVSGAGYYLGETAWSASGGGVSKYVGLPNYQVGTMNGTARGIPDVAYDANPNTGFVVYSGGRWLTFGGTSAGAPQWAALMAIADQGRAMNGSAALDGRSALSMIYNLPTSDFHDVTSGNNGYSTHVGYDLVTGRGTPVANRVVNDLAGFANATLAGRPAGDGATSNSTSNAGAATNGGTLWWFRFSFGPPFFGFNAIARAQPVEQSFDTARVSSAATFAGQPTIILLTQPTVSSAGSSEAVYVRPVAQSYGNGVARLDWSETSDERVEELDLDRIYSNFE
jgi:subtilase family serine protease